MHVQPVELSLIDSRTLAIVWSDGQRRVYSVSELRGKCPCAGCSTERRERPDQWPADWEVSITHMSPVGNYAYNIHFSDRHATGLYTLDLLRELGQETTGQAAGQETS